MTFAKPASVSEAQVYWFDDTGRGGVRVPKSWRLLYKDGNDWKPVEAAGEYGVARDAYNTVRFNFGFTDEQLADLAEFLLSL